MLKRPKIGASVRTMPIFFRSCWTTVEIDRTNSYSIGIPRSINGRITFSSPQVKATAR